MYFYIVLGCWIFWSKIRPQSRGQKRGLNPQFFHWWTPKCCICSQFGIATSSSVLNAGVGVVATPTPASIPNLKSVGVGVDLTRFWRISGSSCCLLVSNVVCWTEDHGRCWRFTCNFPILQHQPLGIGQIATSSSVLVLVLKSCMFSLLLPHRRRSTFATTTHDMQVVKLFLQ